MPFSVGFRSPDSDVSHDLYAPLVLVGRGRVAHSCSHCRRRARLERRAGAHSDAVDRANANCMYGVFSAISDYDHSYGHLPPAVARDSHGRPLSSWRYTITPSLDSGFRGMRFDAKWDDPVNRRWANESVSCYCLAKPAPGPGQTKVVAVTGPGTAFDPARQRRLADIPRDTILLIEMANSGIHWMQPGDLSIDHVPPTITSGVTGRGVHVVFADGLVWFLSRDVPLEKLKKFFTIDGARKNDRNVVLRPYLISEYPGDKSG